MKKYVAIVFVLVAVAQMVFAQEEDAETLPPQVGFAQEEDAGTPPPQVKTRFKPFDMLLGFNYGLGGNISGNPMELKKGTFIFYGDMGVNYDFYILNWLSVGTGLFAHEHMSIILKEDLSSDSNLTITDIMQTPFCLTFPLAVHVNIPHLEWLYLGAGLNINIPLFSLLDTAPNTSGVDLPDTKGSTFISIPIDIGIDFSSERTPKRFIFRIMPNILEADTLVSFGIMYQASRKIYSKK
jgi:hypothetical protein